MQRAKLGMVDGRSSKRSPYTVAVGHPKPEITACGVAGPRTLMGNVSMKCAPVMGKSLRFRMSIVSSTGLPIPNESEEYLFDTSAESNTKRETQPVDALKFPPITDKKLKVSPGDVAFSKIRYMQIVRGCIISSFMMIVEDPTVAV